MKYAVSSRPETTPRAAASGRMPGRPFSHQIVRNTGAKTTTLTPTARSAVRSGSPDDLRTAFQTTWRTATNRTRAKTPGGKAPVYGRASAQGANDRDGSTTRLGLSPEAWAETPTLA